MTESIIETRCLRAAIMDGNITISVQEYKYENNEHYFYLTYTINPKNIFIESSRILKNEMTTIMINHLLLEDEQLMICSGKIKPKYYRKRIIDALFQLSV